MTSILSYIPQASNSKGSNQTAESSFLSSSHPATSDLKTNVSTGTLKELAEKNAKAVKWPIVVDWTGGRASIGDVDGVKAMLDAIKKEQK